MCTQKPLHHYSQPLYHKYKETLDEYINSTVLPALREKYDAEFMLRELVKRWENHKLMVMWLSRFFHYLDKYFIPLRISYSSAELLACCDNILKKGESEDQS